jgi:predicted RNase H-like nuclease (RuvC/YqgF family)
MTEDKKRLASLARGVQSLRRQSRDLRREIDFLDRFSNRLPSRACAAARSYLTMIEHGADLALAQVQQLKAEIASREAATRVQRLAVKLGVPR